MKVGRIVLSLAIAAGTAWIAAPTVTAGEETKWWPYKVEAWDPACSNGDAACWEEPSNAIGKRRAFDYVPLEKASKKWHICTSFPHLKDSYWLGANYGIIDEAKRLGVKMTLVEAGGYTNLEKQIAQVEDCVANGAQAVIYATISAEGNVKQIDELRAKGIRVIDLINGVNAQVDAKSLVSYHNMAYVACKWVADQHPAGSGKVKAAWFPGPPGAGWSVGGDKGCKEAVAGSDVEIIATRWGDTGKEIQLKLVEDVIQAQTSGGKTDLDYVIGTSPTVDAAAVAVRDRGLKGQIKIVAYYYTPAVHMRIGQGAVAAAPTDQMVIQSRIAVDQAVRLLEGKPMATGGTTEFGGTGRTVEHIGPQLFVVDKVRYKTFEPATTLGKEGWKPVFNVD